VLVYELFDAPGGKYSPQSSNYDRNSRRVIMVAAVSLKQALFMAHSNKWSDGVQAGIIAIKGSEGQWRLYTGGTEWAVPWKHNKTFKRI